MNLSFEATQIDCSCQHKPDLNASFTGLMSTQHAREKYLSFRTKVNNPPKLQSKKISLKEQKLKLNPH